MSFNGMMLAGRLNAVVNISISSNQTDWNLITDGYGGVAPTLPQTVYMTVESAVVVTTMDLTGLPDGSVIHLTNLGYIYGTGGSGGDGETLFAEVDV